MYHFYTPKALVFPSDNELLQVTILLETLPPLLLFLPLTLTEIDFILKLPIQLDVDSLFTRNQFAVIQVSKFYGSFSFIN